MKVELAAHDLAIAEEVRIDFDGCEGLRAKIVAAREAGEDDLVRSLQREHRERRIAAAGMTRTAAKTKYIIPRNITKNPATVIRTATSAESSLPSDPEQEITGYLVAWGEALTGTSRDGSGPAIVQDVQPADVAEWLAEVDPAALLVRADHVTAPCGRWHRFEVDDYGLLSTCVVDRTPAGDVLMDACDDGRAPGLSFMADTSGCRQIGTRQGLPLFAGPIKIHEAGPTPQPSDPRATIELVGGERPMWRSQQDAIERAEILRRIRR